MLGGATGLSKLSIYFCLLLIAFVWGGSFVAAGFVLTDVSPILLATVRFIIASGIFLPIMLQDVYGTRRVDRRDLPIMVVLGFLGITVYFWLQYTGIELTGAGVAALLNVGSIPVVTAALSPIVLGERIGLRKAVGIMIGCVGVAVVILQANLRSIVLSPSYVLGGILLVLNSFCWTLYSTIGRRVLRKYSVLLTTAYVSVFGTIMMIPVSFMSKDFASLQRLSSMQWTAILYLASVCSGLAYILWYHVISRIEAV